MSEKKLSHEEKTEGPYRSPDRVQVETARFPGTFYHANVIELFERLAHYGFYIGLSLYLDKIVGMNDVEVGVLLGNWRLVASLAPIPCGAIADRITFKRSLVIAFLGYATAYGTILLVPKKVFVVAALMLAAVAGGFMKPVIMGTVIRTSPPGRQTDGFAIFYRMVNAGSVVGKTLAYLVRRLVALRFVAFTSVLASLASLAIAIFLYEEPKDGEKKESVDAAGIAGFAVSILNLMRGYVRALLNWRFTVFLVIFAGYYFMIEQFYMTFPKYVTRHIDEKAPLEIITLINPGTIAVFGSIVGGFMKRFRPITTMIFGVFFGAISMLVMGAMPTLTGACLSGAIFAFAEMTFSPRFFDYIASFAPDKSKAGMFMGLAFVPSALGATIGGYVSGPLIAKYMSKEGPHDPLRLWGTYAVLGLVCAAVMFVYGMITKRGETKS